MLHWDTAAKPDEKMYGVLADALKTAVHNAVAGVAGACEALVSADYLGLCEWHPSGAPGVCRYYGWRELVGQKLSDVRTRSHTKTIEEPDRLLEVRKTTTDRDYTRHHGRVRIEHHLYDAKVSPWPAKDVPQPSWARALLDSAPAVLRPVLSVVHGEMIRDQIEPIYLGSQKFTESETHEEVIRETPIVRTGWSPAVLLGGRYVLCVWSDTELKQENALNRRLSLKRLWS